MKKTHFSNVQTIYTRSQSVITTEMEAVGWRHLGGRAWGQVASTPALHCSPLGPGSSMGHSGWCFCGAGSFPSGHPGSGPASPSGVVPSTSRSLVAWPVGVWQDWSQVCGGGPMAGASCRDACRAGDGCWIVGRRHMTTRPKTVSRPDVTPPQPSLPSSQQPSAPAEVEVSPQGP